MRKVPKLRFKEFSDEWEEKLYKNIFKINQGLQIAINERFLEPAKNRMFYITNEFLKKDSKIKYYIENPPLNVICNKDDILMTRTGNTGEVVTNVEGAFHNNFFKINYSKEKFNKYFICSLLKSNKIQKTILKLAGTSTIPDLNHSDFYRIKSIFPTLEEQQKIADFLSSVDKKISLTEEKLELFREYKKGVMQKIFSQELRFKDSNGNDYPEWEEKRLGEILTSKGGKALEKYSNDDGDYKFISIGNYSENSKYLDNGKRVILNDDTKKQLLKKDDLVMILNDKTQAGNIIGRVLLIEEDNKYIYNQRSQKIICNSNFSPKFAYCLFNSNYRNNIIQNAQGGTQIYINFSTIENFSINLPTLEEQQKIADFLSSIDSKIESIEKELEGLKEFKKGLLQQMFV